MITLHIAKLLEDEGFGIIDQDLFWEEMPLDSNGNARDGIWIVTGGSTAIVTGKQIGRAHV